MSQRDTQRDGFAQEIGRLSYERLLGFGITRVADITGLDRIGIPGFTSVRPSGRTISISAGKGLTDSQARAGAILEGIELWAAENPNPDSVTWFGPWAVEPKPEGYLWMASEFAQPAIDAPIHANTPISWEIMIHLGTDGRGIWVPSDLVWMTQRVPTPFLYFQTTSNGLASGVSRKDAELSAIYEVVERDAWSIADNLTEHAGQWPERVSLDNLPYPLDEIVGKFFSAGVYPFLFDITNDLQVPAFKALICDPSENSAGMFAGYGCCLDPVVAAKRALLEAAQARCCYIAGARDDLFRRHFVLLKGLDQKKMIEQLSAIPETSKLWVGIAYETIEDELKALIDRLTTFGISEIYSKVLYVDEQLGFNIVRVVMPQLECPRFEHYTPGPRAKKALEEFK